ncbi:uncharacterized protein ISCGN_016538 [Ixodes scapularis]
MNSSQLHLAGDGRADSPSYSTKYGTYTLLDTPVNKLMHFEVLQSTEVKSSSHMEMEGLKRSLEFLLSRGLSEHVLVTDRHIGVNAFMKDRNSDVKHRFDAWHIAEGTEPYMALEKVVMAKQLLKDIPRLSGEGHTFRLESFHSLMLRYTPKSTYSSFEGMVARTSIAVLYYNENSNRMQRRKSRKGKWVLCKIMEPAPYDEVQRLLNSCLGLAEAPPTYKEAAAVNEPRSPQLLLWSVTEGLNKEAAESAHSTRFDQAS